MLATDLAALVDAGRIQLVTGFRIHTVQPAGRAVRLVGDQLDDDALAGGWVLRVEADQVIARYRVPARPRHRRRAAAGAGAGPGERGRPWPAHRPQRPHLRHRPHSRPGRTPPPRTRLCDRGLKSYGRAPTFLLATGYQQVRSIVAAMAGDHAGALYREQGPPAAAICALDRDLLTTAQRQQRLVRFGASPPIGTAAVLGSAADWSAAVCCLTPDGDASAWPQPRRLGSPHLG